MQCPADELYILTELATRFPPLAPGRNAPPGMLGAPTRTLSGLAVFQKLGLETRGEHALEDQDTQVSAAASLHFSQRTHWATSIALALLWIRNTPSYPTIPLFTSLVFINRSNQVPRESDVYNWACSLPRANRVNLLHLLGANMRYQIILVPETYEACHRRGGASLQPMPSEPVTSSQSDEAAVTTGGQP